MACINGAASADGDEVEDEFEDDEASSSTADRTKHSCRSLPRTGDWLTEGRFQYAHMHTRTLWPSPFHLFFVVPFHSTYGLSDESTSAANSLDA